MENANKYFYRAIGWILSGAVFIPQVLEYVGVGESKPFGAKEIIILTIGFFFAVGSNNFKSLARFIGNAFKNKVS